MPGGEKAKDPRCDNDSEQENYKLVKTRLRKVQAGILEADRYTAGVCWLYLGLVIRPPPPTPSSLVEASDSAKYLPFPDPDYQLAISNSLRTAAVCPDYLQPPVCGKPLMECEELLGWGGGVCVCVGVDIGTDLAAFVVTKI